MNRLPVLLLAGVLAGCGGASTHRTAAAPKITPPSAVPTCSPSQVPAGFQLDAARSGPLTAATYSGAADVQAALVYDKLQGGQRSVFTHLKSAGDLVIECNVLDFATADDAHRFVLSFQDLRHQAGSLVTALAGPTVPGASLTVAYRERQQSFQGYGISSTQVIEVGALSSTRFSVVSVAGPTSAPATAQALLTQLASA